MLELNPEYIEIPNFEFSNGEILDIRIEYLTFGHKEIDAHGSIKNGLLYLHGWSGSCNSVSNLDNVIGPDKAIDTKKFYIISPTALGSAGSSSPSINSLGPKFPKYTMEDMVNAHKQLLSLMGISHLKGVMGTSMGGFQAIQWGVKYQDFMDFIILIATSFKSPRQIKGAYGLMSQIITSDPDYNHGHYEKSPIRGMEMGSTIGFLWSLSPEYFEEEFNDDDEFWASIEERNQEILEHDANDIVWRNRAMLNFDLEKELDNFMAETLIVGVKQDQIFPSNISIRPLAEAVNAELFLYDSILGHYGCVKDLDKANEALKTFLSKY